MVAYVVHDSEDAKVIAQYFGMDVPEGRGRFPIARLQETVEAKGDTLDVSKYDTSPVVKLSHYRVTALVMINKRFEVRRAVVDTQQVRDHIGVVSRGRLSQSDIGEAAANLEGWSGYDIVQVERL